MTYDAGFHKNPGVHSLSLSLSLSGKHTVFEKGQGGQNDPPAFLCLMVISGWVDNVCITHSL